MKSLSMNTNENIAFFYFALYFKLNRSLHVRFYNNLHDIGTFDSFYSNEKETKYTELSGKSEKDTRLQEKASKSKKTLVFVNI